MNTGCPRPIVRDTALQLLQLLDKRFFGAVGPLAEGDLGESFSNFYRFSYCFAFSCNFQDFSYFLDLTLEKDT